MRKTIVTIQFQYTSLCNDPFSRIRDCFYYPWTFLSHHSLTLASFADTIQYVVLDEADKMLGMGFFDQIEKIKTLIFGASETKVQAVTTEKKKKKSPKKVRPQVGLFTATMPSEVRTIADTWLALPRRLHLSSGDDDDKDNGTDNTDTSGRRNRQISSTVVQVVQVCAEHKKPAKLMKHLTSINAASATAGLRHLPRILIFANRIKTVRFIHKHITKASNANANPFRAAQLHGEKSQRERDAALKDFKSGKAQILVASDVASRGIDIQNLPYVINYDFPGNLETYVHRVGRTGRLAADGHAFSFFTREMAPLAQGVVDLLEQHDQSVDPHLVQLVEAYEIARQKMKFHTKKGVHRPRDEEGSDDDDGDGDERKPRKEDVLRELEMGGASTKKKKRKMKEEPTPVVEEEFVASKKFVGAKSGYVFTRRGLGQGYYKDYHPSRLRSKMQTNAAVTNKKKKEIPLLPGRAKALKKKQQGRFDDSEASDSDSDSDGGQQEKKVNSKRKSLPGRLRKKLAKQKKTKHM